MIRLRSLRGRLTALVTAAFALWMLLICTGLVVYANQVAARKAHRELALMAETLRHTLADAQKGAPQERWLREFIEQQRNELTTEHMALFVLDRNGVVVAQSQRLIPRWPLDQREDDWQAVAVPDGDRTVVLAQHWGRFEDRLRDQVLVLLALSACAIAAVACGGWLLVGRTLSPISQLSQQATAASTETLHPHLSPPSEDAEMLELVATLNDLLSRLGDAAVVRGRFYAAASHELRTPLQALSGHLEVALSRERPAGEYRASLQEALSQTRRLISLVRDLLQLNQLDTATTLPPAEPVSVADLCDRALQHLAALAEQRGLHVETALEQEGEILAPPTHADMLIRNIIDNAVKYATPGGEVRVSLQERPEGVEVTVFNTAHHLPKLDGEALFEPFFRPEASRNYESVGNGLGLAICKSIALANGWRLSLEHGDDGVRVTVIFNRHRGGQ